MVAAAIAFNPSSAFPGTVAAVITMATPTATGAWSAPTQGLSGRLCVAFEDLRPGLRHAVHVEIRNHLATPLAVTNQPTLRVELHDAAGKAVEKVSLPMSGPIPIAQWGVVPAGAWLGFRVDMQTVGVPTRGQRQALIALGGTMWLVGPGKYRLRATLQYDGAPPGAPAVPWIGTLALPPVEVAVTAQMLAPVNR